MKKNGVTLIEVIASIALLSAAAVGYFQIQKSKVEKELLNEFEYDFSKVILAFENKIMKDKLTQKEYWTNYNLDEVNYSTYLTNNFIDKNSNCTTEFNNIDLDGHNYINCYPKINFKQFKTDMVGEIIFDNYNDFYYYSLIFKPINVENIKKLNLLRRKIKLAFNNSRLYSDVNYFSNGEYISYSNCVMHKYDCSLRLTFSDRSNYLYNSINTANTHDTQTESTWNEYNQSSLDSLVDYSSDISNKNEGVSNTISFEDDYADSIKSTLEKFGISLTNREADDLNDELNTLKEDPEFIQSVKDKMEILCDRYDEDDYYFMSLYEKDNPCYKYKKEGINL